jgi:DNA invertase Pin-like site-specific DNA recombinase
MTIKPAGQAAIYVRISADHQGEALGVQRQEAKCRELAQSLDYEAVRVYVDNDLTAMKANNRPEYRQMLDDVKAGVITAIVAWHPDRLYRRAADLAEFVDVIENAAIPVRTVTAGTVDLTTASGRMTARILGAVALHEVEHAQERMIEASKQAALNGNWRTRIPVFGYTNGGESVVEAEAAAIREGARLLLAGGTTGEIARRWNAAGLVTREGNSFTSRKVVHILRNPRYANLSTYRGEIVGGGTWHAIIDVETHRAVTGVLNGRRTAARDRRWQGTTVYRCGKCGEPMRVTSNGKKAANFYRCSTESAHLWRKQDTLDEYIDSLVIGRLSAEDAHLILKSGNGVDVPALRGKRDGLQAKLIQLTEMFNADEIDGAQLKVGTAQLRADIASIDAQLESAAQRDPLADLICASDLQKRWEKLSADRRGKIIALLMTVTVLPSPHGKRGFDPDFIQVVWNKAS